MSSADPITPSVVRKPWTRSKSSPGVRMVTASGRPASRISSGSSAATVSGRRVCTGPRMRSTGIRLVTRPTRTDVTHRSPLPFLPVTALPPFGAVVLAGGKARRLGGQPKPQLEVGGRSMLAAVLAAVDGADPRVVVGPPQPGPAGARLVGEEPPGGGPVPALAAGLAVVGTDVVAVLAADLPF